MNEVDAIAIIDNLTKRKAGYKIQIDRFIDAISYYLVILFHQSVIILPCNQLHYMSL